MIHFAPVWFNSNFRWWNLQLCCLEMLCPTFSATVSKYSRYPSFLPRKTHLIWCVYQQKWGSNNGMFFPGCTVNNIWSEQFQIEQFNFMIFYGDIWRDGHDQQDTVIFSFCRWKLVSQCLETPTGTTSSNPISMLQMMVRPPNITNIYRVYMSLDDIPQLYLH